MATIPTARSGDRLWVFLATGFGSGYFPFAPATFASLLVTVAYGIISPAPGRIAVVTVLGVAAIIFVAGVPLSRRTEAVLGPDARPIVIDEVVGQLITFAGLPATWPVLAAGFLLFRAADVLKIPPAGDAERLRNGWGVMMDDVVAGVYAHFALRALLAIFGR
jgi:phosphatidylglycerophosphatase A